AAGGGGRGRAGRRPPGAGGRPPPARGPRPPPPSGRPTAGPPASAPPEAKSRAAGDRAAEERAAGRPAADPAAALRRMYVDTSPFSVAHLSLNAEVLGPERMLFGTDSPPMAAPLEDFIHMIEKLPVDEASQRLILGGNAQTLFDLRSRP
ncbi:amidohydrolase family protein, partial [Streptomyces olivaceoviridis]|uniref:amidohydrolase family protein n=1 Tax=Streptomyces olivaceoviridis TaxID=1921 RepID=UPI0033ACD79E